jgi:hypothetical protein
MAAERISARSPVSSSTDAERVLTAEERILAELESAGLVALGEGTLTPFKPLRLAGKPLSETLLEDRNDRF